MFFTKIFKLLLFVCIIFVVGACDVSSQMAAIQSSGQINNIQFPGSLASKKHVGCVSINSLNNEYTPADIYKGARECILDYRFHSAVDLYLLAESYANFDKRRVVDQSARQAHAVLRINNFSSLSKYQKEAFGKKLKEMTKDKRGMFFSALCDDIENLGYPNYYPEYMIKHGMKSFIGGAEETIKSDFNPQKEWKDILENHIKCENVKEISANEAKKIIKKNRQDLVAKGENNYPWSLYRVGDLSKIVFKSRSSEVNKNIHDFKKLLLPPTMDEDNEVFKSFVICTGKVRDVSYYRKSFVAHLGDALASKLTKEIMIAHKNNGIWAITDSKTAMKYKNCNQGDEVMGYFRYFGRFFNNVPMVEVNNINIIGVDE